MIKIFIVTYKCSFLNDTLKSLFESDANSNDYSVEIIVNDPDYYIADEYRDRVTIHLQSLRSVHSNGHLSRDWNQALVLGFGKTLHKPSVPHVILCRDDVIWHKDWQQRLVEIHSKYTFYSCGWGDSFMSFIPNSVRRVGLFDERFCGIRYHEADYFLRQLIYNSQYASINDLINGRVWNQMPDVATNINSDNSNRYGDNNQAFLLKIYKNKWIGVPTKSWRNRTINRLLKRRNIPRYDGISAYPSFEKSLSEPTRSRILHFDDLMKAILKDKAEDRKFRLINERLGVL